MKISALISTVFAIDPVTFLTKKSPSQYRLKTASLKHDLFDGFAALGLNNGMSVFFESESTDLTVVLASPAHEHAAARVAAWLETATLVRPGNFGGAVFHKRPDGMYEASIDRDGFIEALRNSAATLSRTAPQNIHVEGCTAPIWHQLIRKLCGNSSSSRQPAADTLRPAARVQ